MAYTESQDHGTILVTEVVASVGIRPDSTDGPVGIELFDVAGRRVAILRQLEDAPAACATWRAQDSGGSPVAAGTYFYRTRDLREPRRVLAAGKLLVLVR